MQKTFLFSIGVLGIILTSPLSVSANKPVETAVVRLSDSHVLFSLSYNFGFLNRATYVPFLTNQTGGNHPSLRYTITSSDAPEQTILATGILLTKDVAVEDRYYFLPYGKSAEFTLSVIAAIPKGTADYTIVVDDIAYLLQTKDGKLSSTSFPKEQMKNFTATLTQ